jgi:3-hydroxyisobutyrate dehydrogenase-like beta-hydroxyacid dehydrogenase
MDPNKPIHVGILSMGDMGAGIAKLLIAHDFPVVTNVQGRSEDTVKRVKSAGVETVTSDADLVRQCALILSVVPPRDAEAIAQRVIDALANEERDEPLYFADLNAVSPATCKRIDSLFMSAETPVRFIDGCILGGPPRLKGAADPGTNVSASDDADSGWSRPRIPISGPWTLSDATLPGGGDRLAAALNLRAISADVGAASGLKMCFAAVSKGFTALATQSLATAHSLGVAADLRLEMGRVLPAHLAVIDRSVAGMPPKAYRWVREMEEIAATVSGDGGWTPDLFRGAAQVYQAVADDDILGREKVGKRTRGMNAEDVAAVMAEGLARKKHKES